MQRTYRRSPLAVAALVAAAASIAVGCAKGAPAPDSASSPVPTPSADTSTTTSRPAPTPTTTSRTPTAPSTGVTPIGGLGDAAHTRQQPAGRFDDSIQAAWVVTNLNLDTSGRPVAAGDTVYVEDTTNQKLHALDLHTGGPRWSTDLTDGLLGTLTAAGNSVYYLTADATITALDANSGQPRWTWAPPERASISQPLPADGTLYVAGRDHLWTLDAATGRQHADTATGHRVAMGAELIAANGRVYFTTNDADGHRLVAIDPTTGRQAWQTRAYTDTGGGLHQQLLYSNGTIIVGPLTPSPAGPNAIAAFDADTGTPRWEGLTLSDADGLAATLDASAPIAATPSGILIVRHSGGLSAVDAATGNQLWTAAPEQYITLNIGFNDQTDIIVTGDTVQLLAYPPQGGNFQLVNIHAPTGQLLSRTDTDITAAEAAAHNQIQLRESPRYLTAAGDTLVAWFQGAQALAGFTDTTPTPAS